MVVQITPDMTPAQKRRARWALNLLETLKAQGLTPKQFHKMLDAAGCKVTEQAVYLWLGGKVAPKLEHQLVIAEVLRSPVTVLFSVAA